MPTKKNNPIEEHFEKGILGIAAIVLLYILFAFTISSPTSIMIGTEQAAPGQAYKIIRQKADEIDQKVQQQVSLWPKPKAPKVETEPTLTGLPETLRKPLVPVVPISSEKKYIPGIAKKGDFDIPKVLPVQKVVATVGRSTVDLTSEEKLSEIIQVTTKETERSWVSISGQIDLERQRKEVEKYPDRVEKEPVYFRVDLQRAEVGADGKLGAWEPVPSILNPKGLLLSPEDSLKMENLAAVGKIRNPLLKSLKQIEGYALTPDFPVVVAGDEWSDPSQSQEEKKVTKMEKEPTERLDRQPLGRGPGGGPGLPVPSGGGNRKGGSRGGGSRGGKGVGGGGGGGGGGNPMMLGGPGGGGGGAYAPVPGAGGASNKRTSRKSVNVRELNTNPKGEMQGFEGPPGGMPPGAMGPGVYGPGPRKPGMRGQPGITMTDKEEWIKALPDEERKKEKTLWVWVHDFTAKPGKTYKYQMRVVMLNPLAGYKLLLKTPENNLLVGLISPWSEASAPVTVIRENYVFIGSPGDGNKTVNMVVYKWYNGWLYKEIFDVKPGQTIGMKRKEAKVYSKTPVEILQQPAMEMDFNTGIVLQDIQSNVQVTVNEPNGGTRQETATVVTIKMPDGTLVKQDTSNISYDKDLKKCKNIQTIQVQALKNTTKNRQDQTQRQAFQ